MTRGRSILGALVAMIAGGVLAAGSAPGHPGHGNRVVNISGQQYSPAAVSLYEADSVVWNWTGPDTDHSVTAEPGQAEQFDSDPGRVPGIGDHAVGDSFSHVFKTPGRYTYYCKRHPSMRGTVEVKKIDATAPTVTVVRVRPRRLCRTRKKRCARPFLEVAVSEDVNVSGQLERRTRRGWRLVRSVGPMFFPTGPNRKPLRTGALRPGRYRLVVAARDSSGNSSGVERVPFAVRRR